MASNASDSLTRVLWNETVGILLKSCSVHSKMNLGPQASGIGKVKSRKEVQLALPFLAKGTT
jgi:hypothetical protein